MSQPLEGAMADEPEAGRTLADVVCEAVRTGATIVGTPDGLVLERNGTTELAWTSEPSPYFGSLFEAVDLLVEEAQEWDRLLKTGEARYTG